METLSGIDQSGGGGVSGDTFVSRGDPSGYDYAHDVGSGDFTLDGTWNDLDLSSIVPAGATRIKLQVVVFDNTVGAYLRFKKNGNSNDTLAHTAATWASDQYSWFYLDVECDSNRVIEYYGTNITWTYIRVLIQGWWV